MRICSELKSPRNDNEYFTISYQPATTITTTTTTAKNFVRISFYNSKRAMFAKKSVVGFSLVLILSVFHLNDATNLY